MPDTRTVAQEVQEQLVAAMQRGHKQLRKSQEQFRKGQQQFRKGREAVNVAIRTGNELAKSVRPNIPSLPGKGLHLPPLRTLTDPAKLRAHAQEFAGQFATTQRNLADKALQAAGPLVAERVAKLNRVAKSFLEEREHPEPLAPTATKAAAGHAVATAERDGQAKTDTDAAKPAASKPATPKAASSKAASSKTASSRTATAKAGTTKTTGTAKPRTAKAKS